MHYFPTCWGGREGIVFITRLGAAPAFRSLFCRLRSSSIFCCWSILPRKDIFTFNVDVIVRYIKNELKVRANKNQFKKFCSSHHRNAFKKKKKTSPIIKTLDLPLLGLLNAAPPPLSIIPALF